VAQSKKAVISKRFIRQREALPLYIVMHLYKCQIRFSFSFSQFPHLAPHPQKYQTNPPPVWV